MKGAGATVCGATAVPDALRPALGDRLQHALDLARIDLSGGNLKVASTGWPELDVARVDLAGSRRR